MKPMGFFLDYLHGIGKLIVFTNGKMIPKVKNNYICIKFQQPQNLFANISKNFVMRNQKFLIYYSKLLDCPYKFWLCWSNLFLGFLFRCQDLFNLWFQPNTISPFHWTLDLGPSSPMPFIIIIIL